MTKHDTLAQTLGGMAAGVVILLLAFIYSF